MFVRKKSNKSGVVSIQIVDKSSGKYKLIKTIGSSSDPQVIEQLYLQGKQWINNYLGQLQIDFLENNYAKHVSQNITSINTVGIELLITKLYNEIGFNKINSDVFRLLVLARLANPVSKLKTIEYLENYHDIKINKDQIYRYLDKLYNQHKEQIQKISYQHTLQVLNGLISVVFYDVTTLYFQIDDEDEIRKRGFSKDGKHQNPQIVLGLLVSIDGYPLAFDIFEGNKFEGHTMLPVLERFKNKYNLDKLVIVADSGLLSSKNIEQLQEKGYEFILGARIKNEKKNIKDQILSLKLQNGESKIIEKDNNLKLIVSFSEKRAVKDRYNRERGLHRLEKQLQSGRLTKSNINNRGYNKYLKMDGEIKISIDKKRFESDAKWDGLKGYITNSDLPKDVIISNYNHLWKIENAFRISKHDLKIRPIYHRLQNRIEAHITINFAAYKIYKELGRQIKEKELDLSPEKVIDIARTIYQIEIINPRTGIKEKVNLLLNENQKLIAKLFGL
jgi:transposase